MSIRVVITGYNVILPNIFEKKQLTEFLLGDEPSYSFSEDMKDLNFYCQVGGIINGLDSRFASEQTLSQLERASQSTKLGVLCGINATKDAGYLAGDEPDYRLGIIIGSGVGSIEYKANHVVKLVNEKKSRKIGSAGVQNIMGSNISAHLAPLISAGGHTYSISSACCSGSDAIVDAFYKIKSGRADRMLVGGVEHSSMYSWAAFDSLCVLNRHCNQTPKKASAPMSSNAKGFIPSGGAACLFLETYESAIERGAKIYAEILGAHSNCGAQKGTGSMSFQNKEASAKCIDETIKLAGIDVNDIDIVNGHLTATKADPIEIETWKKVFDSYNCELPIVQASKSYVGHTLGAAGPVEIGIVLNQFENEFIHGNLNVLPIHDNINNTIDASKINFKSSKRKKINLCIKGNFGFGDVNSCLILKNMYGQN